MRQLPTRSLIRLLGGGALVLALAGGAHAADIKAEDVDATVKSESAIIQGVVQAESTTIQSGVTTEGTSIKTQVGAQHTATQGAISSAQTAIQTDIADIKTLVQALESGGGAVPCGAGTEGQRFVVYAMEEEVCDNTTGLQWQQEPGSESVVGEGASCNEGAFCDSWQEAVNYCAALGDGSRLPEIKELSSLVDYGEASPALPNGHPFEEVQSAGYWSASTSARNPAVAWFVAFSAGLVGPFGKDDGVVFHHVWCVR